MNLHEEIFEYTVRYFAGDMDSKQLNPGTVEQIIAKYNEGETDYRFTHVYNDSSVTD